MAGGEDDSEVCAGHEQRARTGLRATPPGATGKSYHGSGPNRSADSHLLTTRLERRVRRGRLVARPPGELPRGCLQRRARPWCANPRPWSRAAEDAPSRTPIRHPLRPSPGVQNTCCSAGAHVSKTDQLLVAGLADATPCGRPASTTRVNLYHDLAFGLRERPAASRQSARPDEAASCSRSRSSTGLGARINGAGFVGTVELEGPPPPGQIPVRFA